MHAAGGRPRWPSARCGSPPRACLRRRRPSRPESAAFLEISVADPGSAPKKAFTRLDVRLQPIAVGARAPGLRRLGDRLRRAAGAGAGVPPPPPAPAAPGAAAGRRVGRRAGSRQRRPAPDAAGPVGRAADLDRAELLQVVGDELGVQQDEAAAAQPVDQVDQGDLAGVASRARTCSRRRTRRPARGRRARRPARPRARSRRCGRSRAGAARHRAPISSSLSQVCGRASIGAAQARIRALERRGRRGSRAGRAGSPCAGCAGRGSASSGRMPRRSRLDPGDRRGCRSPRPSGTRRRRRR